MTEAMLFLQKTILLSYDPRPFRRALFDWAAVRRIGAAYRTRGRQSAVLRLRCAVSEDGERERLAAWSHRLPEAVGGGD